MKKIAILINNPEDLKLLKKKFLNNKVTFFAHNLSSKKKEKFKIYDFFSDLKKHDHRVSGHF